MRHAEDMANCCEGKTSELATLKGEQRRVLQIVLVVNAMMFVIEAGAGFIADSTALLADSLDMLGDALVYGFSLYVLSKSVRWQAGAAIAKGTFMLVFGLAVLVEAAYKATQPILPAAETMGVIAGLALAANAFCFTLLYRHRQDNLNLRSTWLCSRNDLIANTAVLASAAMTYLLISKWPDILVGTIIAALFLRSAVQVLIDAVRALREFTPAQRTEPN